ncbi:MAG: magnesium transporter [Candidatus Cloacimonetes bacterium]|nr:magnesium transporter [Candidatus Cloacimonadota bacterium]
MAELGYEQLRIYLDNQQYQELQTVLNQLHPVDIVQLLNDLSADDQKLVFELLDIEVASDVLPHLPDQILEYILADIHTNKLVKIIDEMETDEAADIISEMKEEDSEELLAKIDQQDSQNIKQLLNYDEDSAGGLMQTEIIAVQKSAKRDQLIEDIRKNYDEVEKLNYVYVVDDENRLIGNLDIAKLLLAKPERKAEDIMEPVVISAPVDMDQEHVANLFRKYDIYTLPVVDSENHLLGRITVDDIIDVIDEEASEDAYKMVGLESEDRVFTSPLSSVKKRLPWLTLNLFTALLVSSVVGIFEQTIARLSFLAVLMPIVAGLGGNSGTQTLTVITRGIALGELTIRNTYRAIFKEITVGLINGIIVGSFAMLIAYLLRGDIILGIVLGSAMVCNMFIAGLVGSLIPVIMKMLKIDPALASSVIITMLTDIGGFASFLGLATLFVK